MSSMFPISSRYGSRKTRIRISSEISGRYIFAYDELTGDFGMEIRPVIADQDEGIWQCHVTVHQKGDTYTLTSRSRVKNVRKYQQVCGFLNNYKIIWALRSIPYRKEVNMSRERIP
uniref:Uncharacterized protein n=1 Tax=Parascaris univalens TaxID=6257 RepID=A0A915C6M0_PARUN